MDRNELTYELSKLEHSEIVSLFMKLKDINIKLMARLELAESQLDELTDIDTLIDSIND